MHREIEQDRMLQFPLPCPFVLEFRGLVWHVLN
jgi:hypothetical protein